jgi:hypothetical protein
MPAVLGRPGAELNRVNPLDHPSATLVGYHHFIEGRFKEAAHFQERFAAYQGDESYVFVCYSHGDKDVVYADLEWLHEQHVNVWYVGIEGNKYACLSWPSSFELSLSRARWRGDTLEDLGRSSIGNE